MKYNCRSKGPEGCTVSVALVKCKDCGAFYDPFNMTGDWCEDCFEKGLHKDMNDHFRHTVETELKEMNETAREVTNKGEK